MPIYAYRCDDCGVRKDVLQKISDAPLAQCPECGAPSFHKELTAPAFQLKGSGWYVTDFRDQGKPKDKAGATDKDKAGEPAAAGGPAAGGTGGSETAAGAAGSGAGSAGSAGSAGPGTAGAGAPAPAAGSTGAAAPAA